MAWQRVVAARPTRGTAFTPTVGLIVTSLAMGPPDSPGLEFPVNEVPSIAMERTPPGFF